jgi:predicted DNA-binding WGR domain protein
MALMQFKRIAPVALPKPEPKPEEFIRTDSEPYPIMRNPDYGEKLHDPIMDAKLDASLRLYNDSESGVGYKVWSIERAGKSVTTRWGKEGATMQSNTKTYISEREANENMQAIIRVKRMKGYRETK